VHLHYELLLGDYDTPRRSFGLTAVSPFSYPAAEAASARVAAATEQSAPALHARATGEAPVCEGPIDAPLSVVVRSGDTLSMIARQCYGEERRWALVATCNTFLEERNRGGVSPLFGGDLLYIGDRIVLPGPDGRCPS
jgi:nucleoid-associated protein YgaU